MRCLEIELNGALSTIPGSLYDFYVRLEFKLLLCSGNPNSGTVDGILGLCVSSELNECKWLLFRVNSFEPCLVFLFSMIFFQILFLPNPQDIAQAAGLSARYHMRTLSHLHASIGSVGVHLSQWLNPSC